MKRTYIAVLVCALFAGLFFGAAAKASCAEPTVVKGVYVDDIDLSGMTEAQVEEALDKYVEELGVKPVVIRVGEEKIETTLGELGFKATKEDLAKQAIAFAKSGNLVRRFKETKDLEKSPAQLNVEKSLDDAKIKAFVDSAQKFDQEPQNATITRQDDAFVYGESKQGISVDCEATKKALDAMFAEGMGQDLVLDATMTVVEPKYTHEMVSQCDSVIGTFTTNFSSSTRARANNVAHAVSLINGSVIYPGEEFSVYDTIKP
ncbi:MAG: peptidoglycan binding domain-containing protein, partial [Lachnospiraceae bacterium]|nr:peptidoglycan binding domain-containing protein [Lachnospiraceae bacterium]